MRDNEWNDDPGDDEEWSDDGDELDDDDDAVRCPECDSLISSLTDKCALCGYWLTPADRRKLRSEDVKSWWVTLTVVVLLLMFLATLLWWL
jgi:hypothetical protein